MCFRKNIQNLLINFFSCFFLADDENPDVEEGDNLESTEEKKPEEKPEIISWRRKPDEEGAAQRPPSPSRKRYSPDRRRRQNGQCSCPYV